MIVGQATMRYGLKKREKGTAHKGLPILLRAYRWCSVSAASTTPTQTHSPTTLDGGAASRTSRPTRTTVMISPSIWQCSRDSAAPCPPTHRSQHGHIQVPRPRSNMQAHTRHPFSSQAREWLHQEICTHTFYNGQYGSTLHQAELRRAEHQHPRLARLQAKIIVEHTYEE